MERGILSSGKFLYANTDRESKSIKLKTSVVQQFIFENSVESQSNRFTEIFDAANGVNMSQFKRL